MQTANQNGQALQSALLQQKERLDQDEYRFNNLLETMQANQPVEKRENLLLAEIQSLGGRLQQVEQGVSLIASETQYWKMVVSSLQSEQQNISQTMN